MLLQNLNKLRGGTIFYSLFLNINLDHLKKLAFNVKMQKQHILFAALIQLKGLVHNYVNSFFEVLRYWALKFSIFLRY